MQVAEGSRLPYKLKREGNHAGTRWGDGRQLFFAGVPGA